MRYTTVRRMVVLITANRCANFIHHRYAVCAIFLKFVIERLRQYIQKGPELQSSKPVDNDPWRSFFSLLILYLVRSTDRTLIAFLVDVKNIPQHDRPRLTARKKRIFFGVTLALPIVLLLCAELALRWFEYGPDLSLFKRHEIRGQTYYLMNPDVRFRYFGNLNFVPTTSPEYFQVPKPPGTYRIFCLGGSTTVGYPYWYNGSFSSFLRDRLNATFPRTTIEIINLGMTATNSFTVLDMARELAPYQPDLLLVYDGHNEFYGALGVASHQTVGSSRFIASLHLRLIHLRTYQLVRDGIQKIFGLFVSADKSVSRGTMMETLAHDRTVALRSPMYKAALSSLRTNLVELIEFCRAEELPLILGTQASNLRDHPPFVSNYSPTLSAQQRAAFQQLYQQGKALRSRGMTDSAIVAFQASIALDSLYADAHYLLGQCLDVRGRKLEALRQYVISRDCDELRFRTSSEFNNLLRSMDDGTSCFVADIETAFKSLSPDSLIGNNLMFEHLHPRAAGYFAIAKAYAAVMREHRLLGTRTEWTLADSINEDQLWRNRCVTELDERIAARRTQVLTSGWPFKNQFPAVDAIPPTDTLGQIAEQATQGKLDWKSAHQQAISFFSRRNDLRSVEWEYKAILNQIPLDLEPYMELAKLYFQQNRFADMAAVLTASLSVEPTIQAYRTLGDITLQKGDARGALAFYEQMDRFVQSPGEKLQNSYMLCLAYARAHEPAKAKARLLELLKLRPDYQPAVALLVELGRQLDQRAKE